MFFKKSWKKLHHAKNFLESFRIIDKILYSFRNLQKFYNFFAHLLNQKNLAI